MGRVSVRFLARKSIPKRVLQKVWPEVTRPREKNTPTIGIAGAIVTSRLSGAREVSSC